MSAQHIYQATSPWQVKNFRADQPSVKEYIYQSDVSGWWTVGFWSGDREVRYLHGFVSREEAQDAASKFKIAPPDYQNGFCTIAELPE